ncbi:MAG: BrnT family toxin [Deltaproteobacteria bacterium]|nr:BrnT family toxin [Deltaproteobacteria bacterium]
MMKISFAWSEEKGRTNKKKHGVSFDEAQSVFFDENAIQFFDLDHSESEDRFIMLGMSQRLRVLLVCHCFREEDSVIRIISARKATRTEKQFYGRGKP